MRAMVPPTKNGSWRSLPDSVAIPIATIVALAAGLAFPAACSSACSGNTAAPIADAGFDHMADARHDSATMDRGGSAGSGGAAAESGVGGSAAGAAGASDGGSTGGAAGVYDAGSTGGSTQIGDSGLPLDQEWLLDPDTWTVIPGSEFAQPGCTLKEAKPGKIKFPILTWSPCTDAVACEEADVVQGYGNPQFGGSLFRPTISTHRVGGEESALMAGQHALGTATRNLGPRRTIDLTSGLSTDVYMEDFPAGQQFAMCVIQSCSESALLRPIMAKSQSDAANQEIDGFASVPGRAGFWNQPWLPFSKLGGYAAVFDMDYGGGIELDLADSVVAGMLTPGSSDLTVIAQGSFSDGPANGAGEGDLAIWSTVGLSDAGVLYSSIMGWSPNGGTRTIIPSMATHTCSVGISPTKLVGLTGDNVQACVWYGNARFWATPRAYQPDQVQLSISPPISSTRRSAMKLVTWGDFLASYSVEEGGNPNAPIAYVTVARISDWTIRKLPAPSGQQADGDAFSLTSKYLYVGFMGTAVNEINQIHTVRRYDLSQFESFTQAFP